MKLGAIILTLGALVPIVAQAQDPKQERPGSVGAGSCEGLANMTVNDAAIESAQAVTSGSFLPPGAQAAIPDLPAFCRVTATVKPTIDSDVKVEVWLPTENWNRRFLGTGNGGGAGTINYRMGLVEGLKRGFAVANTDLGTSPNINGTIGHPERWADFGHRANHEMTRIAKEIVAAFYDAPPHHSYFQGCSTGGQQALAIAQRYPDDYDGIIAGAPANNRTHLHNMFVWNYNALNATPRSRFTPAKMELVTKAAVAACAGKDGGHPKDPFLTDPRQCAFNPDTLPKCQATEGDDCLTGEQLAALKKVYAGPTNPRTGERIYTSMPIGSENSRLGLEYQQDPEQLPPQQFYQHKWVFGADFDPSRFDFDRDQDTLDARLAPLLNANTTDLNELKRRGGKILMYTGTADPAVPYQDAMNYYERIVTAQGDLAKTQDFFRFFLVPGMGHCAGGPGLGHFGQPNSPVVPANPNQDALRTLVKWVEDGTAPDTLLATRYENGDVTRPVQMQRPICAYPKFPAYVSGDANLPSSYECVERNRGDVAIPAQRYLN